MRVLVAGCAGFIGYHLTQRLLAEGHEVVGVDNFCSGSRTNAATLQQHPRFRFVEHDITAPLPVEGPLDRIYDLACPASPVDFGPRRLEILAVCSRGVGELLELARRHGARLLHASTSEVYGDPSASGAGAQRDDGDLGVVHPVGLDQPVLAAGELGVLAGDRDYNVLRRSHRSSLADLVLEELRAAEVHSHDARTRARPRY